MKLRYASFLVRGHGIREAEWRRWQGLAAEDVLDEMLQDPFLAERAAPALLFKNNLLRKAATLFGGHSKVTLAGEGEAAYYFKEGGKPCAPSDALTIRPWWDLATEAKVCKEIVQADVWTATTADGREVSCNSDAGKAAPRSQCGCGPNLIRCIPRQLADVYKNAAADELRATATHIVREDRPLAELFTSNATVRGKMVELLYLKSIAESQRMENPEELLARAQDWSEDGHLAPRLEIEDGQHAGILTSSQIMHHVFDPRQRMRIVYEIMWCAAESAPGALPEQVLSLHTPNFSVTDQGWQELASRPICTDCHARLDYGRQFFLGYPNEVTTAWHFLPGKQGIGTGPLYGTGIRDERGAARLHPAGFASLAVQQPEFARCMTKNVAEYVFGPKTTEETIARIAGAAGPELRFRQLLKHALLDFFECESCAPPGIEVASRNEDAKAPVELSTLLAEHCTACHFEGASIPSFEGALAEDLAPRVIDQVLAGRMPPAEPLSPARRMAILEATEREFPMVFGGEPSGVFLMADSDPPAALPIFVAREYAHRTAGATAGSLDDLNAVENALNGRDNIFTPNFAALTALEAFRACRKAKHGKASSPRDPETSTHTDSSSEAARLVTSRCTDEVLRGLWNLRDQAEAK